MAIVFEGCVTARPATSIHARYIDEPSITDLPPAARSMGNGLPGYRLPEPPAAPRPPLVRTFSIFWQVCLIFVFVGATVIGTGLATLHLIGVLRASAAGNMILTLQAVLVYGLFYLLAGSNLVYQCAQYGCIRRLARLPDAVAFEPVASPLYAGGDRAKLLVLVPSYKEQPDIVRQTLISAALAEYPGRRVVLLIDDPPDEGNAGSDPSDMANLSPGLLACRAIPAQLQSLFDAQANRIDTELQGIKAVGPECAQQFAALYDSVADWLEGLAGHFAIAAAATNTAATHTDRLFYENILCEPARQHRRHADALRHSPPGPAGRAREVARLQALLRVEFSSFERKRFTNLSHAPNKAMNLNAFIGLIGGSFRVETQPDGLHLLACAPDRATHRIPPADYIVTVDADSLIMSDYALRLVELMEQPGNERVGVAQTPYTAVPGAPDALERAAAASTDSQFFTHQGMAYLGASFWVGASALVRHRALLDIATTISERGHQVPVFIDGRIQIEDSAATVDLLAKGWQVHHAPGRLTYSATPADFGSLIIQRRRWANGGLLILPRLLRHAFHRSAASPLSWRRITNALLRVSNLISAAIAGIGLPLLLLFPFDDRLVPVWMPLTMLPYYILLGWDLARAGYRWHDLAKVYALTVLLIPANFVGTIQSLRQACGGGAIPFGRTPKILGRTRTPALYVAACYAIPLLGLLQAANDLLERRYMHLLYGLLMSLGALYGIFGLLGAGESWDDLRQGRPLRRVAANVTGRFIGWFRRARPATQMRVGGGSNW